MPAARSGIETVPIDHHMAGTGTQPISQEHRGQVRPRRRERDSLAGAMLNLATRKHNYPALERKVAQLRKVCLIGSEADRREIELGNSGSQDGSGEILIGGSCTTQLPCHRGRPSRGQALDPVQHPTGPVR
jgi:hypothetical protein